MLPSTIHHEMFSGAQSYNYFLSPHLSRCTLSLSLRFRPLGQIVTDASPVTSTMFGTRSSCSSISAERQNQSCVCFVHTGPSALGGSGIFHTLSTMSCTHKCLWKRKSIHWPLHLLNLYKKEVRSS